MKVLLFDLTRLADQHCNHIRGEATNQPVHQHLYLWSTRTVYSYHDPSSVLMCPFYPPLVFFLYSILPACLIIIPTILSTNIFTCGQHVPSFHVMILPPRSVKSSFGILKLNFLPSFSSISHNFPGLSFLFPLIFHSPPHIILFFFDLCSFLAPLPN